MGGRADEIASYCERLGWYLVSIPAGTKGPVAFGWQKPERCVYTAEDAVDYWSRNPDHNVGLLHSASGTVALDVDHVANTRIIFEGLGLDYDAILASGPRIVGRADRGKVLFKAPRGVDLKTHKIAWPIQGQPGKTEVVFELRAGAVQDVLPPSVHPDTGRPYTWAGPSVFDGLPDLPHGLLVLWQEWDRFRPQLQDLCPWRVKPEFAPPPKRRPAGDRTSVIDTYNAAVDIHTALQQAGYKRTAKDRYLSPNSTSGLAGVVVFDDDRAYSHHASDPFDSAHSFDAFDLFCQFEHAGNVAKAVSAAGLAMNISHNPEYTHDAEAIEHGRVMADAILPSRRAKVDRGPLSDIPEHLLSVPGRLQDAVNFYNSTAPKDQPQFAVQCALAFGATVMGRRWVTDQYNMSSLYFVNVGKSAAGKEHVKTTLERLLEAAQLESLIGPSGYTSASGVFSALIDQPNHIAIIDELGRVLQSSQAAGNSHKTDAQTIIMEVFGRQCSTLRPQGFSKMGLTKKQAVEFDKVVRHPALTIMAMTTPSTLYESLSSRYVSDGFLGRFLIVESHVGRQISKGVKRLPVSEQLIEWARECADANAGNIPGAGGYDVPPAAIDIPFDDACDVILTRCDADMIALMDQYERWGMEAMFGRTKEIAQRLALIVARSCGEAVISPQSLQWAIDYATFYAKRTVDALRQHMSDGPFEAVCKAVQERVSASGLAGMTDREIARAVRAYRNLEPRRRKEVLEAIVSDYGIKFRTDGGGPDGGRPKVVWFTPDDV